MSIVAPSTPFKDRVELVIRLTFSPAASSSSAPVTVPPFEGLADTEPGTPEEIAEAIVGILHKAQAYQDDEVKTAEKAFVDWMKANRIGTYSLLLVIPPDQFKTLAASGARWPGLFTPVVLQSMEIVLRAATVLAKYYLYLSKDASLSQLKTASEVVLSMQHGGAVALQHHLNTAEQKAKHTRVTIDKFPDERSDQNDWIQRVELAFKESLQLKFLKDRTTCSKDPAISEQHCATLLLTFSNSVHRPTVEAFSSDNAFDFWESVNNTFCDAINKNDEQMVAWMEIFGLSCTNASKFSSKFSTKVGLQG